jgi:S1-C subfamily serine protease
VLGTERSGSGAFIHPDGLIVTVNYIVLGGHEVRVTLFDGRELAGEVVAQDFASGIALVQVGGRRLPVVAGRRRRRRGARRRRRGVHRRERR